MLPTRLAGLTLLVGMTTALHAPASRPPAVVAPAGVACTQSLSFLQQTTPRSRARITVTYQDADIRDVLAAFANFSGRTIIVGTDVRGLVTTEFRNQPWEVAMELILASQQLSGSEDQYGIITVDNCTKK